MMRYKILHLSVCSDPESVRPERHADGSGLQDERPGGTEADGGVELLLPHRPSAKRGRSGKGNGGKKPRLRSQLSRGSGGRRRYVKKNVCCTRVLVVH